MTTTELDKSTHTNLMKIRRLNIHLVHIIRSFLLQLKLGEPGSVGRFDPAEALAALKPTPKQEMFESKSEKILILLLIWIPDLC